MVVGVSTPNRINTPTTKKEDRETPTHKQASIPRSTHSRKRLAVPYSPTTHQLQYHQRRKA